MDGIIVRSVVGFCDLTLNKDFPCLRLGFAAATGTYILVNSPLKDIYCYEQG